MKSADYWIKQLDLSPLPQEGGMYRRVYCADESISRAALPERFPADRAFSTSIYYLLEQPEFSAFHRLNQDEIWHFYEGSALIVHIIDLSGDYSVRRVGRDIDNDETMQLVIYAGWLFAAEVEQAGSYGLIGCTLAPGFDYADFIVPGRDELLNTYPEHAGIIRRLTRD